MFSVMIDRSAGDKLVSVDLCCLLEDLGDQVDFLYAGFPLCWLVSKGRRSQDGPNGLNRLCWCYLGHNIVSSALDLVGRCLFCKWKHAAVLLLGNRIICCWSDYWLLTNAPNVIGFFFLAYIVSVYMMDSALSLLWFTDQLFYTGVAQP